MNCTASNTFSFPICGRSRIRTCVSDQVRQPKLSRLAHYPSVNSPWCAWPDSSLLCLPHQKTRSDQTGPALLKSFLTSHINTRFCIRIYFILTEITPVIVRSSRDSCSAAQGQNTVLIQSSSHTR